MHAQWVKNSFTNMYVLLLDKTNVAMVLVSLGRLTVEGEPAFDMSKMHTISH